MTTRAQDKLATAFHSPFLRLSWPRPLHWPLGSAIADPVQNQTEPVNQSAAFKGDELFSLMTLPAIC
jgi:hypothetical protein